LLDSSERTPDVGKGYSNALRTAANQGGRRQTMQNAHLRNGTSATGDEPLDCDWGTSSASTGGRGMLLATAIQR